jgi:hypothetical protein
MICGGSYGINGETQTGKRKGERKGEGGAQVYQELGEGLGLAGGGRTATNSSKNAGSRDEGNGELASI